MRLIVDRTRVGCGICVSMCSERISPGPAGSARVDGRPIGEGESVRRAAWAIRSFPHSDLRLVP